MHSNTQVACERIPTASQTYTIVPTSDKPNDGYEDRNEGMYYLVIMASSIQLNESETFAYSFENQYGTNNEGMLSHETVLYHTHFVDYSVHMLIISLT